MKILRWLRLAETVHASVRLFVRLSVCLVMRTLKLGVTK